MIKRRYVNKRTRADCALQEYERPNAMQLPANVSSESAKVTTCSPASPTSAPLQRDILTCSSAPWLDFGALVSDTQVLKNAFEE
jgi:hypothetical protein